jgi:hypothetical protein
VEDPPPHRPEDPFAQEERHPDGHEEADVGDERERQANLDGDLLGVVDDDRELGLGEVDVGSREPAAGTDRAASLLAEARRAAGRPAGGRIGGRGLGGRLWCCGRRAFLGVARAR